MKRAWKTLPMLIALLLALAGAAGPSAAQQQRPAPQPAPVPVMPAHGGEQASGRPAHWPNQAGSERMSPEERRQLRRDINEHGREIYRERRNPR